MPGEVSFSICSGSWFIYNNLRSFPQAREWMSEKGHFGGSPVSEGAKNDSPPKEKYGILRIQYVRTSRRSA